MSKSMGKATVLFEPFVTLLFVLSFALSITSFAFAASDLMVDESGLLSASEEQELEDKLQQYSSEHEADIVIVTVDSLDGKSAMEFADDYYDYAGYGQGENKDGIILLVSTGERDWWISTAGFGITAFTDAGLEYISDKFVSDLSDGDYAKAFNTFADLSNQYFEQAETGEPYDVGNLPKEWDALVWMIAIGFVAGIIIAYLIVLKWKRQLESVKYEHGAQTYIVPGSLTITGSSDTFLYSNVTMTPRPKEQDDNEGGSTTHVSSSGTTHGGMGGKF